MRLGRESLLLVVVPASVLLGAYFMTRPCLAPMQEGGSASLPAEGETEQAPPIVASVRKRVSAAASALAAIPGKERDSGAFEDRGDERPTDSWSMRIVDANGDAVPGAMVRVYRRAAMYFADDTPVGYEPEVLILYPDDDGHVFIPRSRGEWSAVEISAHGFGRIVVDGNKEPSSVVLPPTVDYVGVVRDEFGRPVEGALVRVRDGGISELSVRTNARGEFNVVGAGPKGAVVDVRHPEFASERKRVLEGGSPELSFTVHRGETVSGRTLESLDAQASGEAGAVSLYDRWRQEEVATSELTSDGSYAFSGLTTGRDYLVVFRRGGRVGETAFRAGESPSSAALQPTASLDLVVEDEHATPVKGATLTLRRKDGLPSGMPVVSTDSSGGGLLADLTAGPEYRVVIFHPELAIAELTVKPLDPGERRERRIVLKRPSLLSGRVTSLTGQPVAKAGVRISRKDDVGAPLMWATTDADGWYSASYVAGGNVAILILAPGYETHRRTVEIGPDFETDVSCALGPGPIFGLGG